MKCIVTRKKQFSKKKKVAQNKKLWFHITLLAFTNITL